jgi:hypothetical protein
MNQSKTGNQVVVIAGTAAANGNAGRREPADQRPTARRIVVIRDGESVGGRPGR